MRRRQDRAGRGGTTAGEAKHVVIAPDSFKGSISAGAASTAIADGWRSVRPHDELATIPLADGGEGTLDALAAANEGAIWQQQMVEGPHGHGVSARWLLLPDGTAVVELAQASGLVLADRLDALGASTYGFGQLLAATARHPSVSRLVVTLGGSATTDGAVGRCRRSERGSRTRRVANWPAAEVGCATSP